MAVSSMTGFARAAGASGAWRWAFEIKSVNAKGLDLRLRMPPPLRPRRGRGAGAARQGARARDLLRDPRPPSARGRRPRRASIEARARSDRRRHARRGREGGTRAADDGRTARRCAASSRWSRRRTTRRQVAAACAGALASLDEAIAALTAMRRTEGAALAVVLRERLDAIEALTLAADANPARQPEAVRARLAESVAALMDSSRGFDENRLHQEAILLAAKADIREELDRLKTHVAAARALLGEGGAIGRRLDFLAQEFGREANTLSRQGERRLR